VSRVEFILDPYKIQLGKFVHHMGTISSEAAQKVAGVHPATSYQPIGQGMRHGRAKEPLNPKGAAYKRSQKVSY
jgi:hypothetical protein